MYVLRGIRLFDEGDGGGTAGDSPAASDPPAEKPERVFTQAELNAAVKARLERENIAELKRKASEYDKLAESQKSEIEKAIERATKAEQEREAALAQISQSHVRADFFAKAAEQGVRRPEAAYKLAMAEGYIGEYKDGGVTGHDFKGLKATYPELFAPSANGRGDAGAGYGKAVDTDLRGKAALLAGIEQQAARR